MIKNKDCNQIWVSDTQGLFICPSNGGCKESIEDTKPISFYPNPANSTITLDNYIPNSVVTQIITITDITGRPVINKSLVDSEINVSNLNTGMYILNIIENGEYILTEKLVIKR